MNDQPDMPQGKPKSAKHFQNKKGHNVHVTVEATPPNGVTLDFHSMHSSQAMILDTEEATQLHDALGDVLGNKPNAPTEEK